VRWGSISLRSSQPVCEFDTTTDIVVARKIRVDKCIAVVISRLNALGVYTTGSCCGHGKQVPTATIEKTSSHRAHSLGLKVDTWPTGCPYVELVGLNLALINAVDLPTTSEARMEVRG
jgi:hypothetical protein